MNDYIKIARPDHWIKNAAILPGALLAGVICKPYDIRSEALSLLLAFLSASLIGSSNYTINELLDADEDKRHPDKYSRPVPSGKITTWRAYTQWFVLALAGLTLALIENKAFFLTALLFFVMGIIYNVKPLRAKDLVGVDVLSEAINSPIRFLFGWFAVKCYSMPPVSLLISLWMLAAFFMSIKRMTELRYINDPGIAAAYRKPFIYYNQERLISSAVFYAVLFGTFLGIFIIKYRPMLILALPLIGGFLALYIYEGFKADSVIRYPGKLFKEFFMMGYLFLTLMAIILCFTVPIPWIKSLIP